MNGARLNAAFAAGIRSSSQAPHGVKLPVCGTWDMAHVETNQLSNLLADLEERTEALRGYL